MDAFLVLSDGKIFHGKSFGAEGEAEGEIVFNTSMTGYQEVLTDPSYQGQMVCMTYPLIGNYGINEEDFESVRPFLCGFIIKELSGIPSNWRSKQTLNSFLDKYGIIGIQGIDTRELTRHIRQVGAQQAIISTKNSDLRNLKKRAKEAPSIIGRDLVKSVTCNESYKWNQGEWTIEKGYSENHSPKDFQYFVIAYDLGLKRNILRKLSSLGCMVKVVSANTSAESILKQKPDGVFLSNGPGDPEGVPYVVASVSKLIGKIPIFGICLGHQILSLAMGAKTYKLRFGHHGGNQPVMNLKNRKVEITSQNHGFAVDAKTIGKDIEIISINLNDQTVEGFQHKNHPVFSVQYHPEASPGPHDSNYLFKKFIQLMANY